MPLTRHRRLLLGLLAATMLVAMTAGSATAAIEPAPGGPILVVTNGGDPFSAYYTEILRAEGLDDFATVDIGQLSAATLAGHDTVILASVGLSDAQVEALTGWVQGGGNLIAMSPDKRLAPLLGLTYAGGTVSNANLKIDTSQAPGNGIVGAAMQFHGTADRYALAGARSVATLSRRRAGGDAARRGRRARRGVHLRLGALDRRHRQGNIDWAGQDRDGDAIARSNDLFMSPTPGEGDWVDRSRIAIPQADEQQRLLANLIVQMTTRTPAAALLVPAARREGRNRDDRRRPRQRRHDDRLRPSSWRTTPPGSSVADWGCVRATSYVYPESAITPSQAAFYQSTASRSPCTSGCTRAVRATCPSPRSRI